MINYVGYSVTLEVELQYLQVMAKIVSHSFLSLSSGTWLISCNDGSATNQFFFLLGLLHIHQRYLNCLQPFFMILFKIITSASNFWN